MSAKTVLILGTGPDASLQRAVLATLPNDFRVVEAGTDAEIVLVSGRDGTADAALDLAGRGARTLFVTSPASLTAAQRTRLSTTGCALWIGLPYDVSLIPADFGQGEEPAILDLTSSVSEGGTAGLTDALLAQMALGRVFAGDIVSVSRLFSGSRAIVLEAVAASGLRWRMTAQTGLRDTLAIDRVSRGFRTAITLDLAPHGRPTAVTTFSAAGSHLAWPVFQSGFRNIWSAVRAGKHPDRAIWATLETDIAVIGD